MSALRPPVPAAENGPVRPPRGKLASLLGVLASTSAFAAAAWFLHRELSGIHLSEVLADLGSHSWARIAGAAAFAAVGYFALTGYDALALRYVRRKLPYLRMAVVSFMAFAVGHNVGVAALSGGSIRYRAYSELGLSATDIARIIVFCTLTFALGTAFLIGIALWLEPSPELVAPGVPAGLLAGIGIALVALALAYVGLPLLRRTPLSVGNWRIELPSFPITVAQLSIAIVDLGCAAATLYVLLEPELAIGYGAFLGLYLLALAAGIVSSLPGGIGVFEAVLLIALPDVDREALLSAIIAYRLVYYVAPLSVALVAMSVREVYLHRTGLRRFAGFAGNWLSRVAPVGLGAAVFLGGVVLLVSGASPAIASRLAAIARLVPLPLLELSHLAGSVLGVGLLIVAHGLMNRLRGAYRITQALLVLGIAASLLKGLDYEEAILLGALAAVLWLARAEFYRAGSLIDQRFSLHWAVIIAVAIVGSVWLGFANYRNVPYSNELWWQFSLDAGAPRFLRASLLTVVVAIAFSLRKLMRPAAPPQSVPTDEESAAVRRIIETASDPTANAALLGDKRFLFNAERTAFIMYQISGRSWIALGDPVGPKPERALLVWRYRELCDRYYGWPVFYQISDESLPLYIDMGLTLSKLGEDARVPLAEFSLQGKERGDLRQARNRGKRDGATFEVIPRKQVGALLPQLRTISDRWLAARGAAEKGFSLGAFSEAYVANFDCALVRLRGEIVAFANIWPAPAGRELSVDLMRYSPAAPKQVMDFLFVELLLFAQSRGFAWLNLGMAPLAGLERHPLATVWHKVGNAIFRHGENFYNFEGLRAYKQKFQPVWRPRYLACPGGLVLPRVLLDSAVLIAGGLRRVLGK